jgi:hypothetical protein
MQLVLQLTVYESLEVPATVWYSVDDFNELSTSEFNVTRHSDALPKNATMVTDLMTIHDIFEVAFSFFFSRSGDLEVENAVEIW